MDTYENKPVVIVLETPQQREDMLRVLARGLNTWEPNPPRWLKDLHDRLARRSAYPGLYRDGSFRTAPRAVPAHVLDPEPPRPWHERLLDYLGRHWTVW